MYFGEIAIPLIFSLNNRTYKYFVIMIISLLSVDCDFLLLEISTVIFVNQNEI